MIKKLHWLGFFMMMLSNAQAGEKHRIFIQDSLDASKKEAILILPGLGGKAKLMDVQLNYFKNKGYDVFIPDYTSRKSVDKCLKNLQTFYQSHKLEQYAKVHCFSYILGSWVLNDFIAQNGRKNITTIVYDRSPLQERAPAVLVKCIYPVAWIMKGPLVKDLSKRPYPVMYNDSIQVGIIIESKATPLITMFKKATIKMGEVQWSVDSLHQKYDDYAYTWLHHKEMYFRFDVIGEDIFSFISTGVYTAKAIRESYLWDPFEPYVE